MMVSIAFVYFLIPETKGVPLEFMDRLFEIHLASKAHSTIMAEVRADEENFRHNFDSAGLEVEEMDKVQHLDESEKNRR